MNDSTCAQPPWRGVLDFWFPEQRMTNVDAETHLAHWSWRMHGGADDAIAARFSDLTRDGADGHLDHWAAAPEGRLALIVVLDQFSRSLWRGRPRAFAQDAAALTLSLEGLANGHYQALGAPWLRIAHTQPLGHCEGADHGERMTELVRLRREVAASAPAPLQPIYRGLVKQAEDVREVILAFGRHPHRNRVLGRPSTPAELAYVARGQFPHEKAFRA